MALSCGGDSKLNFVALPAGWAGGGGGSGGGGSGAWDSSGWLAGLGCLVCRCLPALSPYSPIYQGNQPPEGKVPPGNRQEGDCTSAFSRSVGASHRISEIGHHQITSPVSCCRWQHGFWTMTNIF